MWLLANLEPSKMKVLRIINRFNLGGPTYNAGYLTRFMGPEYETMLIGGSPLPDEAHSGFILDNMGVAYIEIPEMGRSINPFNDLRAFWKIRSIMKQYKPDIVHTHAAKAGVLGRLAAVWCGVPVVVHTYHGHVFSGYFSGWKTALIKAVERWMARRSSAIITISREQYTQIVVDHAICPASKAHVIPLGFDLQRFAQNQEKNREQFRAKYGIKPHEVAIGIIGRFAPVKNHTLFFDALAILAKANHQFKALVIGDGNAKSHFLEYTSALKSTDSDFENSKVLFTSWIKEMEVAMAGLDIVVLTSVNEGTPVSLIEAQAAGVPIITTNVGGVRDCMLPETTGLLVEDFDSKSIANAMVQLINNPELRAQMGKEGSVYVNAHFSYQRLVADMKRLYKSLLDANN